MADVETTKDNILDEIDTRLAAGDPSGLDIAGLSKSWALLEGIGITRNPIVVTVTTTVLQTHDALVMDSTLATNFNLPAISATPTGKVYTLNNAGAGLCSVTPNGADLINKVNSAIVLSQDDSVDLMKISTGWRII